MRETTAGGVFARGILRNNAQNAEKRGKKTLKPAQNEKKSDFPLTSKKIYGIMGCRLELLSKNCRGAAHTATSEGRRKGAQGCKTWGETRFVTFLLQVRKSLDSAEDEVV